MSDDPLKPGGALEGALFRRFLNRLSEVREPEIDERIGVWCILKELGRGGSGVVFLAERADGAYEQQVALKWLRSDRPVPGGREVLARERELLASLDHPNIARLIDGGETDDGMRWFAMDFAPGETIDRAAERLDRSQRLQLVATLCRAVHHAHGRGLIHGDIKPSNVLVDERGRPRLVDFGISRLRRAGPGSSYGMTPDYASPEQREGADLTTASDIWQLGHLLEDLLDTVAVPADLGAIIHRATRDAPEERYASASAMAADIEAWMAARPVAARNGGVVYRLSRLVQRNRALSAVTALALLVIVGGGAWMTWQVALERDRARMQADRAEAALAQTEAALARAEALGDFLTDLFEATQPDRPRDELPSTEVILERGAERALDPDTAPPIERFDMLSTIGVVYRSRSRYAEAEPLLEAALSLADETDSLTPLDRARARVQRARLLIANGDPLAEAESRLLEAEALITGQQESWPILARARLIRTWVERHRGRHDVALALIEPVWWQMPPADVAPSLRASVFDSLAGLYLADGQMARAAGFREMATSAFREAQGDTGQGYAVSLANGVGLAFALGRFEAAERQARRAIALYDRIYPEPVDYRAALRRTLARLLLTTGKHEAAFETLRLSGEEYARARGLAPDQWPLYYSTRGHFRARLGDHDSALADFERARELIDRQRSEFDRPLIVSIDLLLGWARCLKGHSGAGTEILDAHGDQQPPLQRDRYRAMWHEARALCHLTGGRPAAALEAIDRAMPGRPDATQLLDFADRSLLRARILAELDRTPDGAEALDRADRAFLSAGLAEHPMRERIDALRRQLSPSP